LDNDNCNHIREIFKNYEINLYEGSFFDYNTNIKFDIIVVNPPYQELKEGNKKSKKVWNTILYKCHNCLNDDGYLLPIHPCGWRDVNGMLKKIFDYNKARNLIYLNMNSYNTGKKYFNCSTNFDYYLLQNTLTNKNITKINDFDNLEYDINLNEWDFIPSGNFNQFKLLLSKNKTNLIDLLRDSSSYHTQKKWIINKKTIYPCIYSITQKDRCKFKYSKEKKGHFGIPKVIWSNGAGTYPIIDENGKYGLTEFAYAIADDVDNLNDIKKALENPYFIKLMSYCIFGKLEKYNYKVIALFKKDFYKKII
jgi:hypothetical protein